MIVERLHTDLLEEKYGKVSAVVLEHNDTRRVIDIVDYQNISRTHAITWFPKDLQNDPLEEVRKEIKNGGLAGKTFTKYGYRISKSFLEGGVVAIPVKLRTSFDTDFSFANFKIYEFWAISDNDKSLFGVIAEIYNPDFLPIIPNPATDSENNTYAKKLLEYLHE